MYKEPLMLEKYEALQELYLKDPLRPLQVISLSILLWVMVSLYLLYISWRSENQISNDSIPLLLLSLSLSLYNPYRAYCTCNSQRTIKKIDEQWYIGTYHSDHASTQSVMKSSFFKIIIFCIPFRDLTSDLQYATSSWYTVSISLQK